MHASSSQGAGAPLGFAFAARVCPSRLPFASAFALCKAMRPLRWEHGEVDCCAWGMTAERCHTARSQLEALLFLQGVAKHMDALTLFVGRGRRSVLAVGCC